MKRRFCRLLHLCLLLCLLSGCQMSRGPFRSARLGSPFVHGPRSGEMETEETIQPVSAERDAPIVTADEKESEGFSARWSKLFDSWKRPKRIPLPRTDVQPPAESQQEAQIDAADAVPSLEDL